MERHRGQGRGLEWQAFLLQQILHLTRAVGLARQDGANGNGWIGLVRQLAPQTRAGSAVVGLDHRLTPTRRSIGFPETTSRRLTG